MNRKRLDTIFAKYIEKFEFLNDSKNDESYKWRIVQMWQDRFNLESEDFAGMLYEICRRTENLIDNKRQLPFTGVVEYARHEPENVRKMFRELFSDDGGDLNSRQRRIRSFIDKTETLRQKYYPDSWKFVNDQRSVMTFLFLQDPEHNYMYKWSQAKEFADCIEFMDDWGSGADYKLAIYYRMCDELVDAIKESPELLKTHDSRFKCQTKPIYRDASYHILAFDVIYCCLVYGLYNGMKYEKINSKDRQLVQERREKASKLFSELCKASENVKLLDEISDYFKEVFQKGARTIHPLFGTGVVEQANESSITVRFDGIESAKVFSTLTAVRDGFIASDDSRFAEMLNRSAEVLKSPYAIRAAYERAKNAFDPYVQYYEPDDTVE